MMGGMDDIQITKNGCRTTMSGANSGATIRSFMVSQRILVSMSNDSNHTRGIIHALKFTLARFKSIEQGRWDLILLETTYSSEKTIAALSPSLQYP